MRPRAPERSGRWQALLLLAPGAHDRIQLDGGPKALGEPLACLGHGHTGPVGGGADVGDGCEQRVVPEVVGLPSDNLLQQVGFGPAMKGCRGQHGVLELVVLPTPEGGFRQEAVPDPLQR